MLIGMPEHLISFDYGSQHAINEWSVNAAKGKDQVNNENVVFDADRDAAEIRVASSLMLYNRVMLQWDEPISTGHLAAIWDYFPSRDWDGNNSTVHTHKMFMLGNFQTKDRRMLEQRFHFFRTDGIEKSEGRGDALWQIDTRPYSIGASQEDEGRGLDRITPWTPRYATVGQWNRFYADVDFDAKPSPVYSAWVRTSDGDLFSVYDKVPLIRIVTQKAGLDFFDPTWVNTSQSSNAAMLTHGWLRDVVVLWSENHLKQLDKIRSIPIPAPILSSGE